MIVLPQRLFDGWKESVKSGSIDRGDRDSSEAFAHSFDKGSLNIVLLVKHEQSRDVNEVQLAQCLLNGFHLMFKSGLTDVHEVNQKVGILKFIQCGPKGTDEIRRQISNETNRVGYDHVPVSWKPESPGGRIKSRKKLVLNPGMAIREGIEKR